MNNFASTYYQSLLNYVQNNSAHITFWMLIFILILVLYILYLSRRITAESSKSAIDAAEKSTRKSEEVGRKIDALNTYLKDVFRKEFGGAMENFDSTVSDVLNEMKTELSQSVANIERIESAVNSRRRIDLQVEEGKSKTQSLIEGEREKHGAADEQKA
jgi:predicted RND superfamily exporter protein